MAASQPDGENVVAIPISHGGHCIGILSVGAYDDGRTFGAKDVELLELFAVIVAVVLENAEVNAELESRLDRIRTLSRLTRQVSTSLDLEHVLLRIARAAAQLTVRSSPPSGWRTRRIARCILGARRTSGSRRTCSIARCRTGRAPPAGSPSTASR